MSLFTPQPRHDWHCKLQTRLSSHSTAELSVTKDGTLPFDPQRIAEDILEAVQNPPLDYPSKPGEFRKTLSYAPQSLISDTRGAPEAPKKRKRSDLRRKSVEDAIEWLNSPPHIHPDKTRIELYLEKRTAYGKSIKHKDDSYKQALETSKRDPRNESVEDRQAAYDRWVAGNHKRLNAAVQATHMDWVTTANKADVEYHLGIVDLDLDKAVKKVLESQVKYLLRILCKQHLHSPDFTGGAYVGVLRARFVIPVSVHHLVTLFCVKSPLEF